MAGLLRDIRGLAEYFATRVPNCRNGGNAGFLRSRRTSVLVAIAKHWGISL
jgi:hypothetical protein